MIRVNLTKREEWSQREMRTSAIYMNYILIVDEGLISSLKLSDVTHVQLITS